MLEDAADGTFVTKEKQGIIDLGVKLSELTPG